MALASLLAGTAMQHVGLGLIHAMSHQVSGFYDTPHGLTNAKLLAPVFAFNLPEMPQEKHATLDSLSEMPFQNVLTEIDRGYGLADEAITIRKSDLEVMSNRARENINAKTNPRVASMEEVQALFRQAFIVE
jgi:alcohol dehydrogenase